MIEPEHVRRLIDRVLLDVELGRRTIDEASKRLRVLAQLLDGRDDAASLAIVTDIVLILEGRKRV